jgi:arsenite methyltransferase
MSTDTSIKDVVKKKYAEIVTDASGCCAGGCGSADGSFLDISDNYTELDGYNPDADLGLGCGVPTEFAEIAAGDVVLDLGSGAGNDVFVARALVGQSGRIIGVDMTEAMIAKANSNRDKLGFTNVEFRLGEIEDLPVSANEIDVVISNCVLNLVPDKARAFAELYRVLKAGGRFCVSDVVTVGEIPAALRESAEMYVGCVAGASDKETYLDTIRAAGFTDLQVRRERAIELDREILERHLNTQGIEELERNGAGIYSVTVTASKPG